MKSPTCTTSSVEVHLNKLNINMVKNPTKINSRLATWHIALVYANPLPTTPTTPSPEALQHLVCCPSAESQNAKSQMPSLTTDNKQFHKTFNCLIIKPFYKSVLADQVHKWSLEAQLLVVIHKMTLNVTTLPCSQWSAVTVGLPTTRTHE